MKIIPIKKLSDDIRHNFDVCLSVSLFKMNDPYRNFGKYVDKFLKLVPTVSPTFFIRLYTDAATYRNPDFKPIIDKQIPQLEIYLYEYPQFIVNKKLGFHDGTFGTLMRFLPLWDQDLWKKYKIRYVWVSDVDVYPAFLDPVILKIMQEQRCKIGHYSTACYDIPWLPNDVHYPVNAGKMIFHRDVKISEQKFNKFLRDILDGKYKPLKTAIEKFYSPTNRGHAVKHRSVTSGKYVVYGFDEYYCNHILNTDMKKYRICVQYNLDLQGMKHFFSDLPHMSEIVEEEFKLWTGQKTDTKQMKEWTDKVYNTIITHDTSVLSPRYQRCLDDYGKLHDNIYENSNIMGPFVIVESESSSGKARATRKSIRKN